MGTSDQNDMALLQSIISESPLLSPILHDWEELALPDCWLVAGAIAQTIWNHSWFFLTLCDSAATFWLSSVLGLLGHTWPASVS